MPTRHVIIDPIADGSNDLAFRRGRWILVGQGIVFALAGGWAFVMALLQGQVFVAGVHVPAVQAGIIAVTGLVSLACALRRRAAALLSGVQSSLFWLLFVVSAAVRDSGPWQEVFGYDAGASLAYLVVAILGLVLVLWLFPRALSDPDWPSSVMRRD
ncbi:hypothetical protein [Kutzneria kofuensis]|uniref:Uncharacterized protein n=1 Tax=Kutzneria kofuensis TaxID=103725 RepID=A0A7W9KR01_9PSEU|nr:hypothetical protein [Kutzneria kofuensis]MBB5897135.1 hypothetical protein [Kutzneria kofuensis]